MECKYCKKKKGEPHEKYCPNEFVAVPSFATKAELEKFLAEATTLIKSNNAWYRPGMYYLSHGEYERPEFVPTRWSDGWGLKVIYHYYPNTLYAPRNGRVEYVQAKVH